MLNTAFTFQGNKLKRYQEMVKSHYKSNKFNVPIYFNI